MQPEHRREEPLVCTCENITERERTLQVTTKSPLESCLPGLHARGLAVHALVKAVNGIEHPTAMTQPGVRTSPGQPPTATSRGAALAQALLWGGLVPRAWTLHSWELCKLKARLAGLLCVIAAVQSADTGRTEVGLQHHHIESMRAESTMGQATNGALLTHRHPLHKVQSKTLAEQ